MGEVGGGEVREEEVGGGEAGGEAGGGKEVRLVRLRAVDFLSIGLPFMPFPLLTWVVEPEPTESEPSIAGSESPGSADGGAGGSEGGREGREGRGSTLAFFSLRFCFCFCSSSSSLLRMVKYSTSLGSRTRFW